MEDSIVPSLKSVMEGKNRTARRTKLSDCRESKRACKSAYSQLRKKLRSCRAEIKDYRDSNAESSLCVQVGLWCDDKRYVDRLLTKPAQLGYLTDSHQQQRYLEALASYLPFSRESLSLQTAAVILTSAAMVLTFLPGAGVGGS